MALPGLFKRFSLNDDQDPGPQTEPILAVCTAAWCVGGLCVEEEEEEEGKDVGRGSIVLKLKRGLLSPTPEAEADLDGGVGEDGCGSMEWGRRMSADMLGLRLQRVSTRKRRARSLCEADKSSNRMVLAAYDPTRSKGSFLTTSASSCTLKSSRHLTTKRAESSCRPCSLSTSFRRLSHSSLVSLSSAFALERDDSCKDIFASKNSIVLSNRLHSPSTAVFSFT
mmetsp:Transcript_36128/g.58408  ORF Transcript_36128/g.58408 Transcript_36128/m.58408 type:complete len:224 (-) Transcript_36128:428-1099(-)